MFDCILVTDVTGETNVTQWAYKHDGNCNEKKVINNKRYS